MVNFIYIHFCTEKWKYLLCVYSVETILMMDSRPVWNMYSTLSNKSEKQYTSLAFIIRIYQDAKSYKCQIVNVCFETWNLTLNAAHNCLSRSLKQNLFIFLWSSWLKKHFHKCKCCQILLAFFFTALLMVFKFSGRPP